MLETLKRINTGVWLAAATMVLAWIWGGIFDAIPQPPARLATWMSAVFRTEDETELALLSEVAYAVAFSYVVVIACYWSLSFWKRRQQR